MDIDDLVRSAERDGVEFTIFRNKLRIGVPKKVSHWNEKLEPYRAEILAFLNGEIIEAPISDTIVATPFPVYCLPGPVGDYVAEASQAIGCDSSFIALPLLASLARAVGNSRVIRLKSTWTEPAIVWTAVLGKSGSHKSPAQLAAMKFLEAQQDRAYQQYLEEMTEYREAKLEFDKDLAAWKKAKSGDPPEEPEEPSCVRFLTTDITVEALAAILDRQFDGVLVVRDELAGFLDSMDKYRGGKGGDTAQYLSCWSGSSLRVERKTGDKKTLFIRRAAVSVTGGIQPEVFRRAMGKEHLADGMCARFLLAMPAPRKVVWTDEVVDWSVESRLQAVFDLLYHLEPGQDENGIPIPTPLDLTPDAKQVWIEFFNRHREEQVGLDDDLCACWSKLEAYAARLALIVQLCKWAAGDAAAGHNVDADSIRAGIELAEWFGNEAKRVYGLFTESDQERDRRELVEWIERRGGRCTCRELQSGNRQYKESGKADHALTQLVNCGIARREVIRTTRKPRTDYVLNGVSAVSASTVSPEMGENLNNVDADNVDSAFGMNGHAREEVSA